jgi:hypothetical protein
MRTFTAADTVNIAAGLAADLGTRVAQIMRNELAERGNFGIVHDNLPHTGWQILHIATA